MTKNKLLLGLPPSNIKMALLEFALGAKDLGGTYLGVDFFNRGSAKDREAQALEETGQDPEQVTNLKVQAGDRYLLSSLTHLTNIGINLLLQTAGVLSQDISFAKYLTGQGVITLSSIKTFLERRGFHVPEGVITGKTIAALGALVLVLLDQNGELKETRDWIVASGLLSMATGLAIKDTKDLEIVKRLFLTAGGGAMIAGTGLELAQSDLAQGVEDASLPTMPLAYGLINLKFTFAEGIQLINSVRARVHTQTND